MATPYAVSSDLVSAYPAKSLAIAQYIDGFKTDLAMVQNAQTGTSYTFALADFTKLLTLNNAAAVAVTLPLEATVAWPTGTQLRLLNIGAGTVTVAGAVGVTINGTPLTLAQFKGAVIIKTGTNTWSFLPFSSGVGAANFSDTATGTYSGFKYKTYTASGTLTITTAGFADIVVCGGGGGGGDRTGGGGGAGGVLVVTNAYLPVGTLTVTVGAGGAAAVSDQGDNGAASRIDSYFGIGGGGGGSMQAGNAAPQGNTGGSGGGGGSNGIASPGGSGAAGQGFAGGAGSTAGTQGPGGGGGGAAAVGAVGATNGGAGGAGTTTSIAGTTPTGAYVAGSYALGGGGGGGPGSGTGGAGGSGGGGAGGTSGSATATAGTANTGGGGGGSGSFGSANGTPAAGGSGLVIVRVAV